LVTVNEHDLLVEIVGADIDRRKLHEEMTKLADMSATEENRARYAELTRKRKTATMRRLRAVRRAEELLTK
jgi:hypothetical protein